MTIGHRRGHARLGLLCAYVGPRRGPCRRAVGTAGERYCYRHRQQLAWTAVYRGGGRP